jgi:hypothetical protein
VATRDRIAQLRTLPDKAIVDVDLACKLILLLGGGVNVEVIEAPTANQLRQTLMATTGQPLKETLTLLTAAAEKNIQDAEDNVADAEWRFQVHGKRLARQGDARANEQRLLDKTALDRVVRYEAHVSRQLKQAQDALEKLQAKRQERGAARIAPQSPLAVPVRSVERVAVPAQAESAPVPEAIARRSQLPPRTETAATSSIGTHSKAFVRLWTP